jgi:hypothetical protein
LPVGLKNFRVQHSERTALLLWETESEENSAYFGVERSQDGIDFILIGTVDAKGNSDQQHYYQFTDSEPLSGVSYYRLKMADLNGNIRYSSIISSKRDNHPIQVIPNPNNGSFRIVGLNGRNKLELCDLQGKVLETRETDQDVISFDLKQDAGVYLLRISNLKSAETIRVLVK